MTHAGSPVRGPAEAGRLPGRRQTLHLTWNTDRSGAGGDAACSALMNSAGTPDPDAARNRGGQHATGITHRDVTPGNVLITGDGFVKLTDFGIARDAAEHTITGAGVVLGSPAYLAPEIANGAPAGPASDAWSLGGTLYACVEGRPPFDKGTPIDTVASVVNDPVPPHPHAAALGPAISGLLVKSPSLRMTITQALTRLRGVADDPSGTRTAPPPARPTDHRLSPELRRKFPTLARHTDILPA